MTDSCRFDDMQTNMISLAAYKEGLPSSQKKKNVSQVKKPKKTILAQNDEEFENSISEGRLVLSLPIRTVSEGNSFEHHLKKHVRHKEQKENVKLALTPLICQISLPCEVILTRYAPRLLDIHDNLPYSFKWIYDQVCDTLIPGLKAGRADNDYRIRVRYAQTKKNCYFIKIQITSTNSTE